MRSHHSTSLGYLVDAVFLCNLTLVCLMIMAFLPPSTTSPLQKALQLTIAHAAALKPWFTRQILQQGFSMIHNGEIDFFSFRRRYAGLITADDIRVTLWMAPGKGQLRYVFRDGACGQCVGLQGGTRCRHTAALALLCLQEVDTRLSPLAESFPVSPWAVIGGYLHNRATVSPIQLHLQPLDDHYLLQGQDAVGLDLQIHLSGVAAMELVNLYSVDGSPDLGLQPFLTRSTSMKQLEEELARLAATPNERILNEHGSMSKQQHLDRSIWLYLARLLFLHVPEHHLTVSRDKEGVYQLDSRTDSDSLFRLILPRLHTWELLDKLSLPDVACSPERAEQFCRVSFSDDGADIEIIHCCRLVDGTEYRLADLESKRYGTRYQADGHIFSLKPVPPEEQLTRGQKGQLTLFAAADGKSGDDHTGFIVKGDEITEFVQAHNSQLRSSRHQVAREILDLKIVDMPTELVLDQYEEDGDWCYLAGWYNLGNRKIRLTELLSAGDEGKDMLPGPTWLRITGSPLSWFHRLGKGRIEQGTGSRKGQIKMRRGEFLALSGQIGTVRNTGRADSGTLPSFLQLSGTPDTMSLPDMATHLRSYQRHGTAWLYQLHRYRLGGILADDMGLGKTHQALALIALLTGVGGGKFLIVCPAAVLYHWPEKQKQFFSNLTMAVHHGPKRDLEKALDNQIVVTTYGILNRDADSFARHHFRLILFDEMHFLKNRKTAAHAAVLQLQAGGIIGLTGTPVENNISELATLLALCLPELFAVKQFRDQFKQADTAEKRKKLQQLVAPFILRRTRKQVLKDLPECSEDIRLCQLSPDQVAAYRQAVDQVKGAVDQLAEGEILSDFSHILTTIIRLKQICNHLCQLEKCTDWNLYASGKWDEFIRLINQCMEAGLKVVVFSQFTTMLDIIEAWLSAEHIDHVGLRGSVAVKERSQRIKRFNTVKKCRVCCASLLAGGTGIDLTGAQVVIHYDRWWNPAKEEQATARVHRMGQSQPVQVYKLVTVGTLEEKIHHLIEKKRELAADLVVEDDGSILKTLDRKELAGLFQYSR